MNIGTKIKKLREERNMSQKDLAFELDISQGAWKTLLLRPTTTIRILQYLFLEILQFTTKWMKILLKRLLIIRFKFHNYLKIKIN